MKFAILLALVAFVAVSAEEEFKCQVDVPYVENECNDCTCHIAGAALSCTYKGCIGPRRTELEKCEVGTTYEKDCNKCWCVKDMGTVCTNHKC